MNTDLLKAPFEWKDVETRVSATNHDKTQGLAVAYIQARAVMDRLDLVIGPEGWNSSYDVVQLGQNVGVQCSIGIKVDETLWVYKTDAAQATDIEPIKGAYSDALKRAAVHWGIGRYLYGLSLGWHPLEKGGKRFTDDAEKKMGPIYQQQVSTIFNNSNAIARTSPPSSPQKDPVPSSTSPVAAAGAEQEYSDDLKERSNAYLKRLKLTQPQYDNFKKEAERLEPMTHHEAAAQAEVQGVESYTKLIQWVRDWDPFADIPAAGEKATEVAK